MENNEGMRFSPKPTKSRTYCCVRTCSSRASREPTVRFHNFPTSKCSFVDIVNEHGKTENVDRRRAWEIALKMKKEATGSMRVCSLHFTKSNYILPDVPAMSRHLKIDAVPSCNLPTSTNAKVRNNRFVRQKKGNQSLQENLAPQDQEQAAIAKEVDRSDRLWSPLYLETGIQATNGFDSLSNCFCATITSDSDLSALTGISSFSTLDDVAKIVLKVAPWLKNNCELSIRHRVVLTLLKLKHNVSYSVLAALFRCSGNSCKKIISQMLDILSSFLKYAIPWPSKDEILQNLPSRFRDHDDVRVAIECIEVFVQRSKNMCSEVKMYSQREGRSTVKFMIGVTPDGVISFVSKSYSGRVTNSAIFAQSGLIELLDKEDAIVVAGDFLIDDICRDAEVRLVRTSPTGNNEQLSKEETLFDAECLRKNLKAFRVLDDGLPADLVNKSDQIFTIICAMPNLSSGILGHVASVVNAIEVYFKDK